MAKRLHSVILFLLFTTLIVRGSLYFNYDWDFLAYHLPFALMHFDATSFRPADYLMEAYYGFPPLVHYVQGAFIVLTGIFSAGVLANGLILGILLISLKSLRYRVRWFLTCCFAMPLFVLHIGSSYIDFWVASAVTLLFAASWCLVHRGLEKRSMLIFLLAILLSMLAKYQAWPFVALLSVIVSISVMIRCVKSRAKWGRSLGFVLVALLFSAAFPARNVIKFGNPTHPVPPPLVHKLFPKSPPKLSKVELNHSTPKYLWEASTPTKFIHSFFELNRLQTTKPQTYGIDQGVPETINNPNFRMGGYLFSTTVGLITFLLLRSIYARKARELIWGLGLWGICAGLLLWIPQNHELRYWMFLPMCGFLILANSLNGDLMSRFIKVYFVISAVYVFSLTVNRYKIDYVELEEAAPDVAMKYWESGIGATQQASMECINNRLPFTIFWAGPDLNTYWVKDCR